MYLNISLCIVKPGPTSCTFYTSDLAVSFPNLARLAAILEVVLPVTILYSCGANLQ